MFKKMYYSAMFTINNTIAGMCEAMFEVCRAMPLTRKRVASWWSLRNVNSVCRMADYLVKWDKLRYES